MASVRTVIKIQNFIVLSFCNFAVYISALNDPIRVLMSTAVPFTMYDPDTQTWHGYAVDVLKEIVALDPFNYTIVTLNSSFVESDNFTELHKAITDGSADLLIGGFTASQAEDGVLDFTDPILTNTIGISVLILRPNMEYKSFLFLEVMEWDVWLIIICILIITATSLWICEKYSPFSNTNSGTKIVVKDETPQKLCIKEYIWLLVLCITPQGGKYNPKHLSGIIIMMTWHCYTFILLASYSANLAAIMTVKSIDKSVENFDFWIKDHKHSFACIINSRTYWYFWHMERIEKTIHDKWKDMSLMKTNNKIREHEFYWDIWEYPLHYTFTKVLQKMKKSGFPATIDEALLRVRSSNSTHKFALISESFLLQHIAGHNCDLVLLNKEFSARLFKFIIKLKSPLKGRLNKSLKELKFKQILEKLHKKWSSGKNCDYDVSQVEGKINLNQIRGLFYWVIMGILLSYICTLINYLRQLFSNRVSTVTNFIP